METRQESLLVLCFHLSLRFEPGLWIGGGDFCIFTMGISERTHLSLRRIFERFLFRTQTAAKRNCRQNTVVNCHRTEIMTVSGPPASGGNRHSPVDGYAEGFFIVG